MTFELRQRDWTIRVAGIEFRDIDIDFEVRKSARGDEPNSCTLSLWNLKKESRQLIEGLNIYEPRGKGATSNRKASGRTIKSGKIPVELVAGYKGSTMGLGTDVLFRGDLRRAITKRQGNDLITTIEGEDGGRSVLAERVQQSYPEGTPVITVVKACTTAMGIGLGNLLEFVSELGGVYDKGTVLDGDAATELAGILRRLGLKFSIQNNAVLVEYRKASKNPRRFAAPVLNYDSGMIGFPERNSTGELVVQALIRPGMHPGSYVLLDTKANKGLFRIAGVSTRGNTQGSEWYHTLNLLPG